MSMERLTIEYDGQYVPKKLCTINSFGEADDCEICNDYCNGIGYCEKCAIQECFNGLAQYENTGVTPERLKIIEDEYSRMAKELSMFRQQNQWIPVAERMPDEGQLIWISIVWADREADVIEGIYINGDLCRTNGVILSRIARAWRLRQIPEPYKTGDENDRK